MKDIGLIGIGLLGTALAERLLQADHGVLGFDLDDAKRGQLRSLGGNPCESAADVVSTCNVVMLSLPDSGIVKKLVRQLAKHWRPGMIVIDTTTGEPEHAEKMSAWLAARRIGYVDATVVGSSEDARAGRAVLLTGGRIEEVARVRDVLDVLGQRVFETGPSGSGARMKLVVNLVLGLNRAVLAEGLKFAEKCGIDPALALEVLRSGAAHSRAMDVKGPKMLREDFAPVARLSQHLKDVRLILKAATKHGAKTPLSRVHRKLLEQAEAAGYGDLDNSAIVKAFE